MDNIDVTTCNLSINNKTNLKTFTIKPFNISVYNFERDSFKNNKNDFNLKSNEGVYLLLNFEKKYLYIGQSGDILNRINSHNNNPEKEKWDEAFLFVSSDFDNNSRLYIENWLISNNSNYLKIEQYDLDNKNNGNEFKETDDEYSNNLNNYFEIVIEEFLKIIIPKKLHGTPELNKIFDIEEIFRYTSSNKGYDSKMKVNSNGKFVLLKGSKIVVEHNTKWYTKSYIDKIEKIHNDQNSVRRISESLFETLVDFEETKPTFLSILTSGSSGNGWEAFRNKDGKTLNEIYRINSK